MMLNLTGKVAIVILNWNGKHDTLRCLGSLKRITYDNYEIIVIDNGSQDGSVEAIKKRFPDIKLIENETNLGFAGGCNQGINYTLQKKSDFVLLLNNDTVVAPTFLTELVKTAKSYANVGIVGPKILDYFRPNKIRFVGGKIGFYRGELSHIGLNELDNGQYNNVEEREFFSAACWLVPTYIFKEIGLFDEEFFIDYEDVDFCIRVRKSGYKLLFCPTSIIWHKEGGTWDHFGGSMGPIRFYWVLRNRIRVILKHALPVQKLVFLFYITLIYPIPLILYALIKRRRLSLIASFFYGILHHLTHIEYYDLKNVSLQKDASIHHA